MKWKLTWKGSESVCMYICLSVCMYICLSVCLHFSSPKWQVISMKFGVRKSCVHISVWFHWKLNFRSILLSSPVRGRFVTAYFYLLLNTFAVMSVVVFVTPCSSVAAYQRFAGTYGLHVQDSRRLHGVATQKTKVDIFHHRGKFKYHIQLCLYFLFYCYYFSTFIDTSQDVFIAFWTPLLHATTRGVWYKKTRLYIALIYCWLMWKTSTEIIVWHEAGPWGAISVYHHSEVTQQYMIFTSLSKEKEFNWAQAPFSSCLNR